MSRRTRKDEIDFANEKSGLAFFSTKLAHIFESNAGNEFGLMLRWKKAHKPELAYDSVHLHPLMIDSHLIEYNIFGHMEAPLPCCFLFTSKLKAGEIINTGQYMNYQTFSNLQFRPVLKNSFHSIHID